MTRLVTWPFLIGGPGDGKPLPSDKGGAALYRRGALYTDESADSSLVYAEWTVRARETVVTCYITADTPYSERTLLALEAMARYALERLP